MTTARRPGTGEIYYPERDGRPMGETELHIRELIRLLQSLDHRYEERPDVYVGGDLLLYYEEGNPRTFVVPDIFVAIGAPKLPQRRIYKLWEEVVPPTLVIEVTSRSTSREDRVTKRALYAQLGVQEYFLYDPLAEYLRPPLQGYALDGGQYRALPEQDGVLTSFALGLTLRLEDGWLRLHDSATGEPLLSATELAAAAQERAAAAEERVAEAEARLVELQRRLSERDAEDRS